MSADTALQRLLNGLPSYFNKDASAAPGITLVYTGGTSAVVTVHHRTLTTSVNGGSGSNLSYNLASFTLGTLVTALNTNTGYTATLLGSSSTSALSLLEVSNQNILTTSFSLQIFTSLLWQILAPIAWALEDFQFNDLNTDLAELCINTADGAWVDAWGALYGNVTRNTGETDLQYAQRIMDEAVRPRLSISAIKRAVSILTNTNIDISNNQADVTKISGKSFVGQTIITDRAHARDQFEVFGTVTTAIQNIINANRAAGINPVYSYTSPNIFGTFVGVGMFDPAPWPTS